MPGNGCRKGFISFRLLAPPDTFNITHTPGGTVLNGWFGCCGWCGWSGCEVSTTCNFWRYIFVGFQLKSLPYHAFVAAPNWPPRQQFVSFFARFHCPHASDSLMTACMQHISAKWKSQTIAIDVGKPFR